MVDIPICVYNHERFLDQTFKGILEQRTDFKFRIIISDDCSQDNSSEIILKYAREFPEIVFPFFQKPNLGISKNSVFVFSKCRSKYIALCDGDDYWYDPNKLQKQVNFLEANPDFVICYHPVNVLFPDGNMKEDYLVKNLVDKKESSIHDLAVLGNYIHTPSVVFRNILKEFPASFEKSPTGDFFLWMLLAQYGKIKKLPDVMAVYRLNVGVHSSQSEKFRLSAFLKTLSLLSETMEDKTIVEILKNRITAIKSVSLPYPVRGLDDYGDLVKAENLKDYVSFGRLIKAIWLKILRRF